ncbi:hypothetical protein GJ744_005113 [Endocarpon pusillum]|uniref:Uncharacterized protein n=1 Tax=Endocarpon pusillum TaxID=364733 RepID=A0A8H7AQA1_9EURO|nr:hypothetical protein GJ744_005113 [Endocarpon pusillum]
MRLQLLLAAMLSFFSLCVLAAPMAQPTDAVVDAALQNRDAITPVVYSLRITETSTILLNSFNSVVGNIFFNSFNGLINVLGTSNAILGTISSAGPLNAIFTGSGDLLGVVAIILTPFEEIIAVAPKVGSAA